MRTRNCLPGVAVAALCLLLARSAVAEPAATVPAPSSATPSPEKVASAWIRAAEHVAAARWKEAKVELSYLMDVAPRWDVAANLGAAELQLGEPQAAAGHLRFARDNVPADVGPQASAWITQQLEQAEAAAPAGEATPPTEVTPTSSADTTRIVQLFTGSALAIAGFSVGAGLLGASRSRSSQAQWRAENLTALGGDCISHPLVCEEIDRNESARDTFAGGAIAGLVVGAGFTVATLVVAFNDDDDAAPSEPALMLVPHVGQNSGLILHGRW